MTIRFITSALRSISIMTVISMGAALAAAEHHAQSFIYSDGKGHEYKESDLTFNVDTIAPVTVSKTKEHAFCEATEAALNKSKLKDDLKKRYKQEIIAAKHNISLGKPGDADIDKLKQISQGFGGLLDFPVFFEAQLMKMGELVDKLNKKHGHK